jgi:uncharacterized protein (TIGR03435 family)
LVPNQVEICWKSPGALGTDKTGLKGAYAFTLDWTSDASHPDSDALVAALKDQLGLDLKLGTVPKEMLIVDHVERVGSN